MRNPVALPKALRNPVAIAKAIRNTFRIVKDPTRLDEVIGLADELSRPEIIGQIAEAAAKDPVGARSLEERPRVHLDLPRFRALPEGTLGRAFVDFLDRNGLDPNDLPHRESDDTFAFVRAHLFETHDIWHVVTGFATDAAGELGLQAFYLAQLPARLAPLLLAVGMLNTLIYSFDDRDRRMDAITAGWQLGRRARPLFGQRWDDLWATPLAEVREQLGITPVAVN